MDKNPTETDFNLNKRPNGIQKSPLDNNMSSRAGTVDQKIPGFSGPPSLAPTAEQQHPGF